MRNYILSLKKFTETKVWIRLCYKIREWNKSINGSAGLPGSGKETYNITTEYIVFLFANYNELRAIYASFWIVHQKD